jgi:hypothetical protein
MRTQTEALRGMLTTLKSRAGTSLGDLVHALPDAYLHMDYKPEYLVLDTLTTLVRWGLAEAYLHDRLLTADDLTQFDRWQSPKDLSFYIAKTAVEIEAALGVALDAAPNTMFGESHLRHTVTSLDIFVLMPFSSDLRHVYEEHIRTFCDRLGLTVARADDFFTVGSIMSDIWHAINHASLIVADCTGRNPNVFYEIGLAHARGKATILIAQNIDDIPFDLRHLRVITYDVTPSGLSILEGALEEVIWGMRWATRLGKMPAVDRPIETVALGQDGWLECPYCEKRFSPESPSSWGGGRHLSCGQRITIAAA